MSDSSSDSDVPVRSTVRKVSNGSAADDDRRDSFDESDPYGYHSKNGRKYERRSTSRSSESDDNDDESDQNAEINKNNSESSLTLCLTNLPSQCRDKEKLNRILSEHIEKCWKIKLREIRCYPDFDIGLIRVNKEFEKRYLLNQVENFKVIIDDTKTWITFTEHFELDNYIVIKPKTDNFLPSTELIREKLNRTVNSQINFDLNALLTPFSNIYHFTLKSLEELEILKQIDELKSENYVAVVFLGADCNFIENLETSITEDDLDKALCKNCSSGKKSSSEIFIQHNKTTNSACIISLKSKRQWLNVNFLTIERKDYPIKKQLRMILRLGPIPKSLKVQEILQHDQLVDHIITHTSEDDYLIIELSNRNVFENCLKKENFQFDKNIKISVKMFHLAETKSLEIDEQTWYKTEMIHQKPTIIPFISNPNHNIFRYIWNPEIWKKQMKKTMENGKESNRDLNDPEHVNRQRLRVTVMLNTLGILKQEKYRIAEENFDLKLNRSMKTIVYKNDSKLMSQRPFPKETPPFKYTTVDIHNEDCIVTYERLHRSKHNPLLLNMANSKKPGGGYREGEAAQEENLFRRSDYCRSLDKQLDEWFSEISPRFRQSNDEKLVKIRDGEEIYPIDKFGSIYTTGVTFFRHSEDTGYQLMENPLTDVSVLAMAALRNPEIEKGMLSKKYANYTRKKIESLFAIAYHNKHDSLVLSAFGCGAFKNPPEHVAKLFLSVIDQYAGFFRAIHFSIIDDHNTGNQMNVKGNFAPFKDILTQVIPARKNILTPGIKVGPFLITSNGSSFADVFVSKDSCKYGGSCKDFLRDDHANNYEHPSLCPHIDASGQCEFFDDEVHRTSFFHPNRCEHGGLCPKIDDPKHNKIVAHPEYCTVGNACNDMSNKHLKQFRHLPNCTDGMNCRKYLEHDSRHCQSFRHLLKRCRHGNHCILFHNEQHRVEFEHTFSKPCPYTPYQCRIFRQFISTDDSSKLGADVRRHCFEFSHVCPFGRYCNNTNSTHWEKTIHISRIACPYREKCKRLLDDEHLNSTSHPGIPDIREPCKYGIDCSQRNELEHARKYRHAESFEQNSFIKHFDLNSETNFVENHKKIIESIESYTKKHGSSSLRSDRIPDDIVRWVQTVQPIHRCNLMVFESMLLHGHVMSRAYMNKLKDSQFIVESVIQHSRIRRIGELKQRVIEDLVREYIHALVALQFENRGLKSSYVVSNKFSSHSTMTDQTNPSDLVKSTERKLTNVIDSSDLRAIKKKTIEITDDSIKLNSNPTGVGFGSDKQLGTDRTVFSVLGPHLGHYYGDIIIVFKREILHHPDSNFTMNAATGYTSGRVFSLRPWLGNDPGHDSSRIQKYHQTKLHAAVSGYDRAAALELIAMTSQHSGKSLIDVKLEDIVNRCFEVDSHLSIEAHLPQLIPISYIDHIYIPKNVDASLNEASKAAIHAMFKHRITLIDHDGFGNQTANFVNSPNAPEKSRDEFQKAAAKTESKKFSKNAQNLYCQIVRGIAITLPANDFIDLYLLPFTIEQTYMYNRSIKKKSSKENTYYIYWQFLGGDMMLSLSDYPITSDRSKSRINCLSCYIARKPSSDSSSYHEEFTYINDSLPLKHSLVQQSKELAAKSNHFFVGCDTDHILTLCLEIQVSTGTVTLSHAGSNGVYNRETVSCQFRSSTLALDKLNYVHISAGSHVVPVNNLFISCEKIDELHPTIDKDFDWKIPTKTPSVGKNEITGKDEKDRDQHRNKQSSKEKNGVKSNGDSDPSSKTKIMKFVNEVIDSGKKILFPDSVSSLKPCRDNVNCLLQHSKQDADRHNAQYSHPCRYSELCQSKESYFTHEKHNVPMCKYDKACTKLDDPYHRANYRHTDLPDFLYPCRHRQSCNDRSNEHRMKFSHGEQVYKTSSTNFVSNHQSASSEPSRNVQPRSPLFNSKPKCLYGNNCYNRTNSHLDKYSHP